MISPLRSAAMIAVALLPVAANAGPIYLANGTISGSGAGANVDLSGLNGPLENGLPGNILGGIGSGLAYAGGNTFLATPDRGPNATVYNAFVDDTTSYISRFQTLSLSLTANSAGTGLPFGLTAALTGTTLLSSPTALNYGAVPGSAPRSTGRRSARARRARTPMDPIISPAARTIMRRARLPIRRTRGSTPNRSASRTMARASSCRTNTDRTSASSIARPAA